MGRARRPGRTSRRDPPPAHLHERRRRLRRARPRRPEGGAGPTIVLHDEIDIPFGEIRVREGGGLAGHNGLKSLKRGFGSADFWRVRIGVGRPDSTDPEIVSAWVLGKFRESPAEVEALVDDAARETERLLERLAEAPETGLSAVDLSHPPADAVDFRTYSGRQDDRAKRAAERSGTAAGADAWQRHGPGIK